MWCQRPTDTAHFAICTYWHQSCKGTPLMAAEWTDVTVPYPFVPNQQALNDKKGYQLNIIVLSFTPESGWIPRLCSNISYKSTNLGKVESIFPEIFHTFSQPRVLGRYKMKLHVFAAIYSYSYPFFVCVFCFADVPSAKGQTCFSFIFFNRSRSEKISESQEIFKKSTIKNWHFLFFCFFFCLFFSQPVKWDCMTNDRDPSVWLPRFRVLSPT